MNTWYIVGIVIAVLVIGGYLWWHSRKSKGMEDKPKPK